MIPTPLQGWSYAELAMLALLILALGVTLGDLWARWRAERRGEVSPCAALLDPPEGAEIQQATSLPARPGKDELAYWYSPQDDTVRLQVRWAEGGQNAVSLVPDRGQMALDVRLQALRALRDDIARGTMPALAIERQERLTGLLWEIRFLR